MGSSLAFLRGMYGFNTGSTFLVNAEVDSMGGVVDGGVGIGTKPSPRRAAIEKAQAELRLEYDVREERRRELEFLEKGGNPLDFKFGRAVAVSVQSTSHTDQHPDQNFTSEAKGSFALTASPHGDSVESSGRLGVTTACEPNSADNFDGENEILQSDRKAVHAGRGSITPSEHSSQLDGSQNIKESEDSPIFHPKKGQAYRRRNRSRTNRDGPRSSSADMATRGGHGSSMPGRHGSLSKPVASQNPFEVDSDGTHVMNSTTTLRASELSEGKLNVSTLKEKLEEVHSQSVKGDESRGATGTVESDVVGGREIVVTLEVERPPSSGAEKREDNGTSIELNELSKMNGDGKRTQTEAHINNAPIVTKGLDSEFSCTHNSVSVDGNGNSDADLYTNLKTVDSNGAIHNPPSGEKLVSRDDKMLCDKEITNAMETAPCIKEDQNSVGPQGNGFAVKNLDEDDKGGSSSRDEAKVSTNVEEQEHNTQTKLEKEPDLLGDSVPKMESSCPMRPPSSVDPSPVELNSNHLSASPSVSKPEPCVENQLKQSDKAHEDRVLEEARSIEAKRKRIAELSEGSLPGQHRRKSQWDFVLEEMAWLANDFAQERLWKMTAARQICHHVAFASRLRLEEESKCQKLKSVAHSLAKAVMEFWQSARLSVQEPDSSQPEKSKHDPSSEADKIGLGKGEAEGPKEDMASEDVSQSTRRKQHLAVHGYAVRFLQFNCCSRPLVEVEMPGTPNVACDIALPELLWEDQFTEENLFYIIPPGAMEMYRKSIESCLAESERMGNTIQEEVDTSMYDPAAEFDQDYDYEEDEGENVCYLPGAFETGRPSKKKRKNIKSYAARSYDLGGDFGYGQCLENRNGMPQSVVMGKRPANNLHVGSIPTKRMRTASRQRVIGPFGAGPPGILPVSSRADASSGDTNSFQDDQSTLHGGSTAPRGSEVDSEMDFEKQSAFDSTEISAKPKKKKKIKGAAYDHRWQLDSSMQIEQKDHVRKRLGNHQLESNGNCGLFGQHAKKPKFMKHSLDNSFDNTLPMSGSVASPVASQMSNMSGQSNIVRLAVTRDKGRKSKGHKASVGQPESGSPWSGFEDQALIVLVHDMGPNWELVSDAINSSLQFKRIFRKPQECKERHKSLMDKSGDGADSAEDSGSSQPYPSTLPGIPKGSARQLFQRLQVPIVEDTIKSHFEKIIHIGQQLYYRKKKSDNQDLKQLAPVHGSHIVALSQVIPNNVNGGVLTPLDLCDIASSTQDQLHIGLQSSHAGGLPLPNQGSSPAIHPPSGLTSSVQGLQGSPGMGIGSNLAAQSSQFTSPRDARYSAPRSASLPMEEQQRLHQYSPMHPGRNVQPSNLSSTGSLSGTDRGMRMPPGGNGGMTSGMNRSLPTSRPGLRGVPSSSMLNSGSMLASNVGGMTSNMNVHSGTAPGQGNTMFRPRDALHMVRPGQSSEHQRQMMLPEMQMQATQPNSPGVSPYGGLSSGFSNQSASPPLQTYPGHHQQQHPMPQPHPHVLNSPHISTLNHSAADQQAYLQLARERQIQQRLLQRQHQQLPTSSALATHVQSPSQLPMSSPIQSGSQLQSPSSQPVSMSPLTTSPITHVPSQSQQQQKHQFTQGHGRNAQSAGGGMMNQVSKQRQRQAQQLQQQYQQVGRQHPQQRQQSVSQQQAKLLKGIGRSNMPMHQTLPIDASQLNGLSANPGSQVTDKAEQAAHLMQGQGVYSGSGLSTVPASKPLPSPQISSHSQPQNPFVNTGATASKPVRQLSSNLGGGDQGQAPGPSPAVASSTQSHPPTSTPSLNHQQLQGNSQPPNKMVNQSQPAIQRASQHNRQINSDPMLKLQPDHIPLDQQFANNNSSSAGAPPACVDSASEIPVSSSASTALRKVQESLCDSTITSTSASSGHINSSALTNSAVNESVASVSQGLGQRQLSGNLVSHGHAAQWQHQQSQLQQPPPRQSILPQKQSQQQLQQLEQSSQIVPQPQP